MHQDERLRLVIAAQRDAGEVADADVDRHPHSAQMAVQDDTFAMQFDVPDAAIRTLIVRIEADR